MAKLNSKLCKDIKSKRHLLLIQLRESKRRKTLLHLELFKQKKITMKRNNTLIPNAKPILG